MPPLCSLFRLCSLIILLKRFRFLSSLPTIGSFVILCLPQSWWTGRTSIPFPLPSRRLPIGRFGLTPPLANSRWSLYFSLRRQSFNRFTGVWCAPIPLNIKIFLWQTIRLHLPANDQIIKHHENAEATFSLCGENENTEHIIFWCVLARFVWIFVRSWLTANWNPNSFMDLFMRLAKYSGQFIHGFWSAFVVLSWFLWTTHNKFTIEHLFPNRPSDCLFKMVVLLPQCIPLAKPMDVDATSMMISKICGSTFTLAHPSSPPMS